MYKKNKHVCVCVYIYICVCVCMYFRSQAGKKDKATREDNI